MELKVTIADTERNWDQQWIAFTKGKREEEPDNHPTKDHPYNKDRE